MMITMTIITATIMVIIILTMSRRAPARPAATPLPAARAGFCSAPEGRGHTSRTGPRRALRPHSSRDAPVAGPPGMLERMKFFFRLSWFFCCCCCITSFARRVSTLGLSMTGTMYFGWVPRTR